MRASTFMFMIAGTCLIGIVASVILGGAWLTYPIASFIVWGPIITVFALIMRSTGS